MSFRYTKAVRENTNVLIAVAGPSGSGKTYSAMELATGICGDEPFLVGDTEARRALHYADQFDFEHVEIKPPFTPKKHSDFVREAVKRGFKVALMDSASHLWEGEGGVLDMAEASKRTPPGNWIKPKAEYKRMVNVFLQAGIHLIFCLRAHEKIRIRDSEVLDPRGAHKKVVESMGWQPICEKRFMYEMTASFTLAPENPGIIDMGLPHKIQDQHRAAFPPGRHITRAGGEILARWARGETIENPDKELWDRMRQAAHEGTAAMKAYAVTQLGADERQRLAPIRAELLAIAAEADKEVDAWKAGTPDVAPTNN